MNEAVQIALIATIGPSIAAICGLFVALNTKRIANGLDAKVSKVDEKIDKNTEVTKSTNDVLDGAVERILRVGLISAKALLASSPSDENHRLVTEASMRLSDHVQNKVVLDATRPQSDDYPVTPKQ